jgi:hypothetical protein
MLKKILDIYNGLLVKLFGFKIFCVDYERFMSRQRKKCGGILTPENVQKRCRRLIFFASLTTVFLTFWATVPTDVCISLPVAVLDFIQFQIFLNLIEQHLLYLYGAEDLRGKDGIIDGRNGEFLMWLQTEAMLGIKGSIKNKIKSTGSFILRKTIALIFTKSPFRLVVISFLRQFLKWCGVVVTHELLLSSLDILVVGLCALIAALVSLWQFLPMCRNFFRNIKTHGVAFYASAFYNTHLPNS